MYRYKVGLRCDLSPSDGPLIWKSVLLETMPTIEIGAVLAVAFVLLPCAPQLHRPDRGWAAVGAIPRVDGPGPTVVPLHDHGRVVRKKYQEPAVSRMVDAVVRQKPVALEQQEVHGGIGGLGQAIELGRPRGAGFVAWRGVLGPGLGADQFLKQPHGTGGSGTFLADPGRRRCEYGLHLGPFRLAEAHMCRVRAPVATADVEGRGLWVRRETESHEAGGWRRANSGTPDEDCRDSEGDDEAFRPLCFRWSYRPVRPHPSISR